MSLRRRIRNVEKRLGRSEKPCAEVFLRRAFTSEEQMQAEAELRKWELGLRSKGSSEDEQNTGRRRSMNLRSRLKRLERRCLGLGQPRVPWFAGEAEGLEVEGEFLTWGEYERRFPEGPRPLRWADPESIPESNTTKAKP